MIDVMLPDRERLNQLLADRALFGLSDEEQSELASLLPQFPDTDADCFDRIAACVDLALGPKCWEPLPESLNSRIRQQALDHMKAKHTADQATPTPAADGSATRRSQFALREISAWALAAAAIAAAVLIWFYPPSLGETPPSLAELRKQLMREADDTVLVTWQTTGDPSSEGTSGDVVWSNAQQRGYMRFRDLIANDPKQSQYQLWIFDADRDDRYPIDGGVFDMGAGTEDYVVPIKAKLKVMRPVMFAVTVEKPGGVVVSNRERISLVAKIDG
jgi:hypothetical protein